MADVVESIGITWVRSHFPLNYYECGIAEQNMISVAGGMSTNWLIPFVSVYSNFCAKRAADQVRLNDINATNVKMVCTHAGLSVWPDGPTHHALDDVSWILALRNTLLLEPADANMTIHITKYITSFYGNCYVRIWKHPLDIITKEDGSVYYDEGYIFEYGKTDIIREWSDVTLVAIGSPCFEAFQATQKLELEWISVEFIIASSYKDFDEKIFRSVQKTGKIVVIEDCFIDSGLGVSIKSYLFDRWVSLSKEKFLSLWPVGYHMCADSRENLYDSAGISTEKIIHTVINCK
jgi:transketolase